jgi:hypothetical protein
MTPDELAALPAGTIVLLDAEAGEIVKAGKVTEIMWPESGCTNMIDTKSEAWYSFIADLKQEGL